MARALHTRGQRPARGTGIAELQPNGLSRRATGAPAIGPCNTMTLLNRFSMRASLIATIVVMGLLGLALALFTARLYESVAREAHQAALAELFFHRITDLSRDIDVEAQLRIAPLLSDQAFIESLRANKADIARERLVRLWSEPGKIHGINNMVQLAALRSDFTLLASAGPGLATQPSSLLCQGMPSIAAGTEQSPGVVLSGVCADRRRPNYATVIRLDGQPAAGYLVVLTDWWPRLRALESSFSVQLAFTGAGGRLLYQSSQWRGAGTDQFARATQDVPLISGERASLTVARSLKAFSEESLQTRIIILLTALLTTVATALIALLVLRGTAIKPLAQLASQLRRVRQDEEALGEPVAVQGSSEVRELAAGFNAMTARLKELYASLEHMAYTDPLTQLPNRVLLMDRLQQAILGARRDNRPFALFLMDLDRFKDINDTLGHQVGDQLLEQVARRLRAKLRQSDTVARLGGDEFAVLLPNVTEKYAGMAARMLLQALRVPFEVAEQSLDIGASIGVALYPEHGVDANVLIQRADVAMYSAKHTHAGHVFYETRLDEHNPGRLMRMGELRRAVEQEQFVLHYQPMISLTTGRVVRVEALLRWQHPREGLMMPDSFVPLLEQSGLIRALTPWLLNEALTLVHELHQQELSVVLAVNLSGRDLQDFLLADTLAEQLAARQVEPGWLELEITESAVMEDPARAHDLLQRLADMGLRITVDDFGTGYSSLAYLKKLPVSAVKIDKSFVTGMERSENDAIIVRTSIDLAHNLGLSVIAEGVESDDLLRRLAELGCDVAQGFYLSRPLAPDELITWLKESFWGLHSRTTGLDAGRSLHH
jgi:diguanylate cyclase (GGDEF)-like protein